MGRADVARHRKATSAVTSPVDFPHHAKWMLSHLQSHPDRQLAHAIASLRDAPSQRAQLAALKLLAVALLDSHSANAAVPCICRSDHQPNHSPHSSCHLAATVLSAFLFESPDATAGLRAAALRVFVRCHHLNLPTLNRAINSFLDYFRRFHHPTPNFTFTPSTFEAAVAHIGAASVLLADPAVKNCLLPHRDLEPSVMHGVLHTVIHLTNMYVDATSADTSVHISPHSSSPVYPTPQTSAPDSQSRPMSATLSKKLLESGCDSSMKATQDILTSMARAPSLLISHQLLANVVTACQRVILLPSAPRNCSMASAVAFVTGRLLHSTTDLTPIAIATFLRETFLSCILDYSPIAQLAVLRAIMEAPVATPAIPHLLFPPDDTKTSPSFPGGEPSLFGLLVTLSSSCADAHLRFMAMDAVIACLRRLAPAPLPTHHRDLVLRLVRARAHDPFAGVAVQMRDAVHALLAVDGGSVSTSFWIDLAARLARGRGDNRAMYGPLSVLVARVGAMALLDAAPGCQTRALHAAADDARLAKPVAEWLAALWTKLRAESAENHDCFADAVHPAIVAALVNDQVPALRERVAEHMLPVFFTAVGSRSDVAAFGARLLKDIASPQDGPVSRAACMRASVTVMSSARKAGVSLASFTNPEVREMLLDALSSIDEDLRAAAFDLVTTCQSSTEPIEKEELDLVLRYLPTALMGGGPPAARSRFRHSMRRLFERVVAVRQAAVNSSGVWLRLRKEKHGGKRTKEFEASRKAVLERLDAFEVECLSILVASTYPGASVARRANVLEILSVASRTLGFERFFASLAHSRAASVTAILVGINDDWERPRRATYEFIRSLDSPLPGLENLQQAEALLDFAIPLLDSPRQRDVDAGALFCRTVFTKFVLHMDQQPTLRITEAETSDHSHSSQNQHSECDEWVGFPFSTPDAHRAFKCNDKDMPVASEQSPVPLRMGNVKELTLSPATYYANSLLDSIEAVITLSSSDFQKACEKGLFHGRFLVLRYIVQDMPWKAFLLSHRLPALRHLGQRMLDISERCIRIALEAVSYQSICKVDNDDNNEEGDEIDSNHAVEDGEGTESIEAADRIFLKESRKVVMTTSFLSVKEICVSIGVLSHQVCQVLLEHSSSSNPGILSMMDVERMGKLYMYVLANSRHWGVIDGAAEGFQLLSEKLLVNPDSRVRSLPKDWVLDMIRSAISGDLYVLRRSAGLPALVCALVDAEASCNRRSHEAPLLSGVMTLLLRHLSDSHLFTEAHQMTDVRTKEENGVSHALNLLRSLFLNGTISGNVMKHFEASVIICIEAFSSLSWLIRNSAMMLFSALIRRGVGVVVERKEDDLRTSFEVAGDTSATLDGHRRFNGVTAFQFFSRHPKLHPFLLSKLEQATLIVSNEGSDHPALYPTLYLLSSLSPAKTEDSTGAISLKPFRDILSRCSQWRGEYMRRAAAAAMVPLVEDNAQVGEIIEAAFAFGMRKRLSTSQGDANGLDNVAKELLMTTVPANQNHIHGSLLTVDAVLKSMGPTMSRRDKTDNVKVLAALLPQCIWVAVDGRRNPCSYTRASMVDVLSGAYGMAMEVKKDNSEDIEDGMKAALEIMELCRSAVKQIQEIAVKDVETIQSIGIASLRVRAAEFVGRVLLDGVDRGEESMNETLDVFVSLIQARHDECVNVGLKLCVRLISTIRRDMENGWKENDETDWTKGIGRVWRTVCSKVDVDASEEVVINVLRVLNCMVDMRGCSKQYGKCVDVSEVDVKKVAVMAGGHRCIDVREKAVILLGSILGQEGEWGDVEMLWLEAVVDASGGQAASLRKAACTSVRQYGIDLRKDGDGKQWRMRDEIGVAGLLIVGRLVEDENMEVSRHCCEVVHGCVSDGTDGNGREVLGSLMEVYAGVADGAYWCAMVARRVEVLNVSACGKDVVYELTREMLGVRESESESVGDVMVKRQMVVGGGNMDKKSEGKESGLLFPMEMEVGCGETVVQMQVVGWMLERMIKRHGGQVKMERAIEVSGRLMDEMREEVTRWDGGDEFARCYGKVVRLVMGMRWCMQAGDGDEREADRRETAVGLVGECARQMVEQAGERLHPVVTRALCGVRDFADCARRDMEADTSAMLRQLLFLIG